jgi:hypothetical protein
MKDEAKAKDPEVIGQYQRCTILLRLHSLPYRAGPTANQRLAYEPYLPNSVGHP